MMKRILLFVLQLQLLTTTLSAASLIDAAFAVSNCAARIDEAIVARGGTTSGGLAAAPAAIRAIPDPEVTRFLKRDDDPGYTLDGGLDFGDGSPFYALIRTLGYNAFCRNQWLRSVNLPGVTNTEAQAFRSCSNLVSVTLPTLVNVGYGMCYNCTRLGDIDLPCAETVGEAAFLQSGITNAVLPRARTVGPRAFVECRGLRHVNLTNAIEIGSNAFRPSGLTEIDMPRVGSVGYAAFAECPGLRRIGLQSVTNIGEFAFWASSGSVEEIDFGRVRTLTYPHHETIYGAQATLRSLDLSSFPGVLTDGYFKSQFQRLASVSIGSIVIPAECFYGCTSLTNVNAQSATTVGSGAFVSCTSLRDVRLPSAEYVQGYAFNGCSALRDVRLPKLVRIDDITAAYPWPSTDVFSYGNLFVNTMSTAAAIETLDIGSVTKLADNCFVLITSLRDVDISSVTSIPLQCFYGCTLLTNVNAQSATTVANGAFVYCSSLKRLSLPSVQSVGQYAFNWYESNRAEEVSLPSATNFAQNALFGCATDKLVIGTALTPGQEEAYLTIWGLPRPCEVWHTGGTVRYDYKE